MIFGQNIRKIIDSFSHLVVHSSLKNHHFVSSFIHMFIHSFVCSFFQCYVERLKLWFFHRFGKNTRKFIGSFIHSLIHTFIHEKIKSWLHSFIHPSSIHSSISLFILFIHLFIYSFSISVICCAKIIAGLRQFGFWIRWCKAGL